MTAYTYNNETMEYIGQTKCQLDPVRSAREGREVWLLPGDSVWIAPPEFDPKTKKAVWSGEAWVLEDLPPEPEPGPEPDPTYTSDEIMAVILGLEVPGNAGGGALTT